MLNEKPFREYVKNAGHYLAIGEKEIYLFGDQEKPWEIATSCEGGSSHRMDIATSVNFRGPHPCGLTFRWSWDLEPRSANGSGSYQVDTAGIQRVLAKLENYKCRQEFLDYLTDCAVKIEKKADEYQEAAKVQYASAAVIRNASKASTLVAG